MDELLETLRLVATIGVVGLGVFVVRRLLRLLAPELRGRVGIGVMVAVGVVALLAYTPVYEASDPRANCAAGGGARYGSPEWRFVADVVSLLAVVFFPLGSVLAVTRIAGGASYNTRFILGALVLTASVLALLVIILGNSLATGMQCI